MGAPLTTLFIHTRAREGRGPTASGRWPPASNLFFLAFLFSYGVTVRDTRSQKYGHPSPPCFHSDISGRTLSLARGCRRRADVADSFSPKVGSDDDGAGAAAAQRPTPRRGNDARSE